MKIALPVFSFSLVAFAFTLTAGEPLANPFSSIVADGDMIVATLPAKGKWLVTIESAEERLSSPSEIFSIRVNTSLTLTERHTTYHFTARLTPEPGLDVYSVFDRRSFGGDGTKKHYFLKAQ